MSTAPKDIIFKRLKKFITLEQFSRVENIRCKDKSYVSAQLFDNAILYEDAESGEIIFHGFFPLQFVKSHHCILTFKGKILVKDGNYSYTLSDFTVIEFLGAPKTKGKSSGSAFAYGSAAFGSSHSTSSFSDKQLRSTPLEEFMLNSEYAVSSDADFNESRKSMIKRMKEIVNGAN